MNIHTVAENLRNTIAGKEALLDEYESKNILLAGMLRVNIDELRRILQDVEQCCEQATAASWATNPDRSGGQFTQDEINNADRWV